MSREITENVRVYCRVRPDLPEDTTEEANFYVTGDGAEANNAVISSVDTGGVIEYFIPSTKKEHTFTFNGCFKGTNNQQKVYDEVARPIVQSSLEGYSGTVFCYGPTASGKTFTMVGEGDENRGIIPRTFEHLLLHPSAQITVSYLQIYCEVISDLLDPSRQHLSIREHNGNIFVEGLSSVLITSMADVAPFLAQGERNRSTASTHMNEASSRSHAAVLINISKHDESKQMKQSTLVLVDLAGSERASATSGLYARQEESRAINLSLCALSNCISALADNQTFIPYRDSKLTRLLQNCLGGGARAAVIVNVSSKSDTGGEVLNALRFGSKLRKVKVIAKQHRVVDFEALYYEVQQQLDTRESTERNLQMKLSQYEKTIEDNQNQMEMLRDEVATLTEQLRYAESDSTEQESFQQQIQELTEKHMKDLTSQRQRYEQRINAYKKAASESNQEIATLQYELQCEKERHLATMQSYKSTHEKLITSETQFESRIQDLLVQLDTLRNSTSEQGDGEGTMKDEEIAYLTDQLKALEASCNDMVSREKVEEMEKMFLSTVNSLADRVQQLEERNAAYKLKLSDMELPPVPQRESKGPARLEPGRIRPQLGEDRSKGRLRI